MKWGDGMNRRRKALAGGIGAGCLCAALLYAHAAGPDPRHTAAPGDDPLACATSGCHVGTPLNGGGGNVSVNFPNGMSYTPGVAQTFSIVITDSKAKVYGFQMSARLESDLVNGQAGDFTAGTGQIVLCAAGLGSPGLFKPKAGCPANNPVEFIEHYLAPFKTNTISVTWTPPATSSGNIRIYVAANAANGDTTEVGDHIYTASYVLAPPATTGCTNSVPAITAVVSASGFNANAGLASGTWLEIYGTNLSCTTRGWAASDFQGSNAPQSLDGVSVSIGGVKAFVDYVSPGQVNVQAGDDSKTGSGFPIVVTNSAGSSNSISMTKNAIAPAVLAPASFNVSGRQYVVAQFADGTYVGKTNLIPGLNFRPAIPGDVITIYGIGFGPVNPTTGAGVIAPVNSRLISQPSFLFGQTLGALAYYGLTPSLVGLYQFNIVVPRVSAGDIPLNVSMGSVTLDQALFITIGQ